MTTTAHLAIAPPPTTRRVTITFVMPVGNPDRGAEIDLEVTADCDTNADDILDGVTFVEPTLRDLRDYYNERYIERIQLACAEQAQRDLEMEQAAADRGREMANELLTLGAQMGVLVGGGK